MTNNDNELGRTSRKYESGNNGPGTISSGKGDLGEVSYGTYQFASVGGFNSSVSKFLKESSYGYKFENVLPGSKQFSRIWEKICETDADKFGKEQHDYIRERYYDNAIAKLRRLSVNEEFLCFGLKELIWSTAVQFGPSGCFNIFKRANATAEDSNIQMINKVYKEKSRVQAYFRSSSNKVQNYILQRYAAERLQNIADCQEDK